MKKTTIIAIVILLFTLLTGCGGETKQPHIFDFEKQEPVTITINDEKINCVGVYGTYTNNSEESACAADWVYVKAYQNGVELSPLVPAEEKTNDYLQCDKYIEPQSSQKVIYLFEMVDDSNVTIEIDGKTIE